MSATVLYIWHDDKPQFDEVRWLPDGTSNEAAQGIALLKMAVDPRATRVHVEVGLGSLLVGLESAA